MALIKLNNQSYTSGSAFLPSGTIIQNVSTTSTTQYTTTSSSYQDATDYAVSITPSSSSNKVYISYAIWGIVQDTNHHIVWSLKRTVGGVDTTLTSTSHGFSAFYSHNGNSEQGPCVCSFVDSPGASSAVTYTPLFKSNEGSTVKLGAGSRTGSTVAFEIKG
jgi:hypothetical protein